MNSFAFQHTLSNKKRADCILFLPEPTGHIIIDAKFPLESYKQLSNIPVDGQRNTAEQTFKVDIRKHISDIALATRGVKSVHAIRTRRVGAGWYVDLHIQVDPEMSVKKGHDISEKVKQRLLDEGPDILDVVVHLEPFE